MAAPRRRSDATIDLTPMLDVVFNLLLFFMVSTNFIRSPQTPGIQVDLPRSSAQSILSEERDLNIWMAADGSVYIDDQPVDFEGLRGEMKRRAALDPDTLVVIKADSGVSHGRVVGIMDQAKAFGLSRLAIATQVNSDE